MTFNVQKRTSTASTASTASTVTALNDSIKEAIYIIERKPLERVLAIGVTGSGKSFQWLKMAVSLRPLGSIFRVIDTDNDIDYMMRTQFPELLPENGGNVYIYPACDWPEYKLATRWIRQKDYPKQALNDLDKYLLHAYNTPIKHIDWVIPDKSNNAWSTVTSYFVEEAFGEDLGDYFLRIRKQLREAGDIGKDGKKATSTVREALDGWKDWSVINKLYEDWIKPIVYSVRCNVYATADVEPLDRNNKDAEVQLLFGGFGIKAAGQKKIGGQMHTIFLYIPGDEKWMITTVKDRANRSYFKKNILSDFYRQYLVVKAGWPYIDKED